MDIPREVNLLKIKLELFYYAYNKTKNISSSKEVAINILENKIDFIGESCDINEFFDCHQNINDREFFLALLLDLKNELDS